MSCSVRAGECRRFTAECYEPRIDDLARLGESDHVERGDRETWYASWPASEKANADQALSGCTTELEIARDHPVCRPWPSVLSCRRYQPLQERPMTTMKDPTTVQPTAAGLPERLSTASSDAIDAGKIPRLTLIYRRGEIGHFALGFADVGKGRCARTPSSASTDDQTLTSVSCSCSSRAWSRSTTPCRHPGMEGARRLRGRLHGDLQDEAP
jgi:hypothetical protein